MTYVDFVAAVTEELGPDGTRRGIEALRARATRDALIDLQRYIRAFRKGHATIYTANDLVAKSCAMAGPLPAQAKPKAFYIYRVQSAPATTPDPEITSWATLAEIPTLLMATGTIRIWVDAASGAFKITQLRAGTDATDTASGIQRPDDYDTTSNARVWYQS